MFIPLDHWSMHIDQFGIIDTSSISGKKYRLIIIDDTSILTLDKLLRSKDESFDVLSVFYKQIQNEKETSVLELCNKMGLLKQKINLLCFR